MALRILTVLIQAGLVFTAVYAFIKLVQAELADRRWWKEQLKAMQGKSAWRP